MRGATDIKLRVSMDSTQARADAQRMHQEITRRFRRGTADDAVKLLWDKATGMPPNPFNPNLPYEHARHSGIWWANHGGHKALGNPEYRKQFFTEREAKYMGLQFARAAKKELVESAKAFGFSLIGVLAHEGIPTAVNYYSRVGKNNRGKEVAGAYAGGILGGAASGAAAGFALGTVVPVIGNTVGAIGGAVIGGIGGAFGGVNTQIRHRNEDDQLRLGVRMERLQIARNRQTGLSDFALQSQIGMMPSRQGRLNLMERHLHELHSGKGSETINKLEKLRRAMIEGGKYEGVRYKKGDWTNTERGQQAQALLERRRAQYESLRMQYWQTKYTIPHAKPMEAVTDSYSQRGLFHGGQVNVQKVNTIIVDKMQTIIGLLEKIRADNPAAKFMGDSPTNINKVY